MNDGDEVLSEEILDMDSADLSQVAFLIRVTSLETGSVL